MPDEVQYEICLEGQLDDRWIEWLGSDASCTPALGSAPPIYTWIVSRFDQSSLHGFLRRLPDLGVVLISLRRLPEDPASVGR